MNCNELHETFPDVAAGMSTRSAEATEHLNGCNACATELSELRATMALLDTWQAPEPSPYFNTRLQARLRETRSAEQRHGWFAWMRRPAMAVVATVALAIGVGMFALKTSHTNAAGNAANKVEAMNEPGTAVSDLKALEENHELYSDFEVLDELDAPQGNTQNQ